MVNVDSATVSPILSTLDTAEKPRQNRAMVSDNTQVWLDVLQILIPALLIVGGGAAAYWRYIRDQERAGSNAASEFRLKAGQAAWERVQYTVDSQAERINALEVEVKELRQEVEELRTENRVLSNLLDERNL